MIEENTIVKLLLSTIPQRNWVALQLIQRSDIWEKEIHEALYQYLQSLKPFYEVAIKTLAKLESTQLFELLNFKNKIPLPIVIDVSRYLVSFEKALTKSQVEMLIEQLINTQVNSNIKRNISKRLLKYKFTDCPVNISDLIKFTDTSQIEEMFELLAHIDHNVHLNLLKYLQILPKINALEKWLQLLEIIYRHSGNDLAIFVKLIPSNSERLAFFLDKSRSNSGQIFSQIVDPLNENSQSAKVIMRSLPLTRLDWSMAKNAFVTWLTQFNFSKRFIRG